MFDAFIKRENKPRTWKDVKFPHIGKLDVANVYVLFHTNECGTVISSTMKKGMLALGNPGYLTTWNMNSFIPVEEGFTIALVSK